MSQIAFLSYWQKYLLVLCFLCCCPFISLAQSISGYVYNEDDEPIPYANIYITELGSGAATDAEGHYFITLDVIGEYQLVVSSIGYESKKIDVIIEDEKETFQQDVRLQTAAFELEEMVIKASRRDSAYAIIKKVVENKQKYIKQIPSYKTQVYVKATEEIEEKKKKKTPAQLAKEEEKKKKEEARKAKEREKEAKKKEEEPGIFDDPDKVAADKKKKEAPKVNMVEMQVDLSYQYPNKYKEERTAYKAYGRKAGLFIPTFDETDFNFYKNMVSLTGVGEMPVISPISRTAILSYKFKLIESVKEENGQIVHKIKVTPRKSGNSTCNGFIYINEGLWNINRLDLHFNKGTLKFFDSFRLQQNYEVIQDSLWIPYRIACTYATKQGRSKTFHGSTTFHYSDFQPYYEFPPKFFNNEVVLTTKEAYKKDSTYWNETRPEPLTQKQQKMVAFRDSVKAVRESKVYKDSVQAAYNKIKPIEVFWEGLGFRNHERKENIFLGPLPSIIDFSLVGGFRLGVPYSGYSRRWENGQFLFLSAGASIGLKNKDVNGDIRSRFRYNPHKLADIRLSFGREFGTINNFDAFLNQIRVSNYIRRNYVSVGHGFELFNGFRLNTSATFSNRKSIEGLETDSFVERFFREDAAIHTFNPYKALITEWSISYTPFQKFMTEPNRKIILGSKWPTFTFTHQKGWNGPLESEIDFDYIEFSLRQDLVLGMLGESKYNVRTGKYINSKDLRFVDQKRFRQSDRYWYADPLNAFQELDTSIATRNLFIEAHWIHHFNGALVNNIPLIKKTRVRIVTGGGFMWAREENFNHQEIFGGLERVFKLGARRRMRLGVYGVFARSSIAKPQPGIKFSIDVIDTWDRNWDY